MRTKKNGFYRSLGLTRAGFYDRLGGSGGRRDEPPKEQPSRPARSSPRSASGGRSLGLTKKAQRVIMKHDLVEQTVPVASLLARAPHKARKCEKGRRDTPCGTCYEKAKGRID